jgi:uncharacterized membrane protein
MKSKSSYIRQMTEIEDEHLNKLHSIVQNALNEETLLTFKLAETGTDDKVTFGALLADRVASFGGSWKFIILFVAILIAWITTNTFLLVSKPFDPYPFILLNLILSCVAALQAPVIMMSQNRKELKDRKRAENDYLINLKSEIEIRNLHEKMDLSIVDQFKHLCDIQQKQLEMLERIEKLMEAVKNQLNTVK